jgi:hypothetical protein
LSPRTAKSQTAFARSGSRSKHIECAMEQTRTDPVAGPVIYVSDFLIRGLHYKLDDQGRVVGFSVGATGFLSFEAFGLPLGPHILLFKRYGGLFHRA